MMMMDNSSLSIPVPNIITSSPSGGRFDFDDGGTYCGGWQDGKAHGHGVCTGPKNVGEYSGSWNFGFEMSGVYKWKNGAVYEGRWQNGKRHGVGVEYNGKWIYKGEWSQGFKGRYGVKASSNSAVKYEGTWANGLQDGYGSETYSDGGYYQGQMCKGLRHGYGVRKSAPYGDSQLNNPNKNGTTQLTVGIGGATATGTTSSMMIHSNSLQSATSVDMEDDSPKPEDGFKPNIDRTLASKNGFVLVAKPLDVPMPTSSLASSKYNGDNNSSRSGHRRNSLTNKLASARIPGSQSTASLLRGLGLRKQKSTSDLDAISGGGGRNTPDGRSSRLTTTGQHHSSAMDDLPAIPFSLSPEELDITDPTTVETYTGEWKQDKRNGHGICDRSDGLKYEGQWHNDMKCGYGVTTFKNGTKEEGKYKNNILIAESKVKKFFQLGSSNIRQKIDDAVKMAQQAQTMALKKAEIADTRAATARDKADQATTAALEADRDSQIAFSVARQYSDSQQQLGMGFQQQQQQLQIGGNPNSLYQQQQQQSNNPLQMEPMLPNLGMAQSSLQMRRLSQQQQQLINRYASHQQMQADQSGMLMQQGGMEIDQAGNTMQQQQHGHMNLANQQPAGQQQYLGPVEPFNGRRGSFRGGGGSHQSSGYQSGFASQRASHPINFGSGAPSSQANAFAQSTNRQSSDPFNDLFDHYKSTGSSPSSAGLGPNARRMLPGKQTSLDYSQLRASVPRQFGPGSSYAGTSEHGGPADRLTRRPTFRMSSLDHAEENQKKSQDNNNNNNQATSTQQQQQQYQMMLDPDGNPMQQQQQLKHLVTSGEDLQQQQASLHGQVSGAEMAASQSASASTAMGQPAMTPSGSSSYILPQSTGSSYFGNQTPSPDGGQSSSFRSPSSQYYSRQQQQQHGQLQQQVSMSGGGGGGGYPAGVFQQQAGAQFAPHLMMKQRDVHSLADEQLYMANRRMQQQASLLDKTDYANYDFTISNSPRPSRRCMRRTASLSRNTPIRSSVVERRSHSNTGSTLNALAQPHTTTTTTTMGDQHGRRSASPAISGPSANRLVSDFQAPTFRLVGAPNDFSAGPNHIGGGGGANIGAGGALDAPSNSSHLTLDSSSASSGLLRKPSLQVRYNPDELGGLMSREEVAALSHAQREQRRLEAEMAEQRAKRPLLNLYLILKELLTSHKIFLSFVVINIFLGKMFFDLIV